jgi:tetratricopeptide (TPR) repeat protein
VAEALLREAIAEDPEFASAHMLLAYAIFNQARPPAEYQPAARRASELAHQTSERERHYIEGSYYYLLGDPEKAIAAWTILVKLYPDHFGATDNLAELHHQLYRPAQATAYAMRRAQLRPNDFIVNVRAADFLIRLGRTSEAKPYLKRAAGLDLTQAMERYPARVVWLQLIPAREAIGEGELHRAVTLLRRFDEAPWPAQGGVFYQLALCYMDLGMLREAERWVERIELPSLRHGLLARLAATRKDEAAARHHLRLMVEAKNRFSAMDVELLVGAGMVQEAQRSVALMSTRPSLPEANFYPPANAQVSLARAHVRRLTNPADAVELLQESIREASPNEEWVRLEAQYWLADLLDGQGDRAAAIRTLQPTASLRPNFLFLNNLGFHWMRTQARLAVLYRQAGREADAQRLEKQLRRRLAHADPEHVIVRGLRETATVASSPAGR